MTSIRYKHWMFHCDQSVIKGTLYKQSVKLDSMWFNLFRCYLLRLQLHALHSLQGKLTTNSEAESMLNEVTLMHNPSI
jgi:hypothetical protein